MYTIKYIIKIIREPSLPKNYITAVFTVYRYKFNNNL